MKPRYIVLALLLAILAVIVGWKFDFNDNLYSQVDELFIPDDIDYYFTSLNYRVMDEDGQPDYQLRSPYLAHYRRADISRVTSPDIHIFRDQQQWLVSAEKAELDHQKQLISLHQNVELERTGENALNLTSQLILFEPGENRLSSPGPINMNSSETRITASSAEFDLKKNVYHLKQIIAVYHAKNS